MSKYSFKSLFESSLDLGAGEQVRIESIVIPRIQRDYAQGRKVKKGEMLLLNDQGQRFIGNIFDHLKEGKPMEMDFIYGAIDDNGRFLPLDGQQRLTTLYLLYWYIGGRELKDKSELYSMLQRFSYDTRASARQFCEKLSGGIDLKYDQEGPISEQLKDCSWCSKMYERDPTVVAMMNMLDEIHRQYLKLERGRYYDNLEKLTFNLLPLNRFHLTDELYIKMNARGKQLTDFENFKADLTNWMMQCTDLSDIQPYRENRSMPHHMVLSNKMDNEWLDALWELSKLREPSKKIVSYPSIDELFLFLLYRWFLFEHIFASEDTNKEMDKNPIFEFFEEESEYVDLKPFTDLLTGECLKHLEHALDLFSANYKDILECSKPSWSSDSYAYFLLDKGITIPQRVVLYGVWTYLGTNNDFDKEKFRQWMRVVWNIVENTDIDSWRAAIGVLMLLRELGEYSGDIYKKYPDNLKARSNASDEEIRKVLFIRKDPSWEKFFIEAEKQPFLRGGIGFMIKEDMKMEEFKHRTEMAAVVFDEKGFSSTYREEHLLLRAIISEYENFDDLNNRNFTDTDEKEHYLKKMLAGDEVVKDALYSWLTLEYQEDLMEALQEAVRMPSQVNFPTFGKKMHEDLYRTPHLQEWMQNNKAIRFAVHDSGSYFVWRPNAWYDWVMLDSYRDEMIDTLVKEYDLTRPSHIAVEGSTNYYIRKSIELRRPVVCQENVEVIFEYYFDPEGILRIGVKEGLSEHDAFVDKLKSIPFDEEEQEAGWICRKTYNYKEVTNKDEVKDFLQRVKKDVFDPENPSSLVSQINHRVCSQLTQKPSLM